MTLHTTTIMNILYIFIYADLRFLLRRLHLNVGINKNINTNKKEISKRRRFGLFLKEIN